MFDKWPITKVIELTATKLEDQDGYDAFFSVSPVIEYRATDGYWMVLQTEMDYIVIGYDGVKVVDRIPGLDDDSEYYAEEQFEDSYDTPLFKGEHLIDVRKESERYILKFDHFDMYLFPTEKGQLYYQPNSEYIPIHGYERLITRECECGGNAELMLDHVGDFFVRCSKCHKFTWAYYIVQDVIDDWNMNDLADKTTMLGSEEFDEYRDKKIRYIALSSDMYGYDENQYTCSSILIVYDNIYFRISSHRTDVDTFDFDIQALSGYNKKFWPRRVVASDDEPITFIRKEAWEDDINMLRFQIGKRPILICADEMEITIGLTHWDTKDNWIEYSDNKLLNDDVE